jgi:hypothetical protein
LRDKTSAVRSEALTATFTPAEMERLEALIGDQKPGSWAHDALMAVADRQPFEQTLHAEVVALRITVMNFYRAALAGEHLTYEAAKQHIANAEREAKALIAQVPF